MATIAPPETRPAPPPVADLPSWTAALFRAIDAKDTEGFMGFLAPQARFAFGNSPPATGTEAIRATLQGFFGSLETLEHAVEDAWAVPGHVVCRGSVRYVRRDGRDVSTPFCNVLGLQGGRVADYRIYIDPSPLLAP